MTDIPSQTLPTSAVPNDLAAPPQSSVPTQQPQSTPPTFADTLNSVLKVAPELGQSPGLAVGVASSGGDPTLRAQSVAHVANAISNAKAQGNVSDAVGGNVVTQALNWFGNSVAHVATTVGGDIQHAGTQAVSAIGHVLNIPLGIAQHEYRYLHDVEARHGILAATMEGLGIAAGAGLGFMGGGVYGAELGGQLAAGLEGQVLYHDSWQRTASGSYVDPNTHRPVSLGRDVMSALGLPPNTMTYKVGSGIIDGIADMQVGGGETLGLIGKARSAEGASGLLGHYFGGTAPLNGEDIERVYNQYGSVRNAFQDIANKSAGELVATPAYRSLLAVTPHASTAAESVVSSNQFIQALGRASTPEEVGQVFKEVLRTHELAFTDRLPTLSFTRIPFNALRSRLENLPTTDSKILGLVSPGNWAQKLTRLPDSYDSVAKSFSSKTFNPSDPLDDGARGIYNMVRYSETRNVAASVAEEYINAPDLASKVRIYRNATLNLLNSMAFHNGFLDTQGMTEEEIMNAAGFTHPQDQKEIKAALDSLLGGGNLGHTGLYALDDQGRNISMVADRSEAGRQYSSGVLDNHTGNLNYISPTQAREVAAQLSGSRRILGRMDDIGYNYVTQKLFKPLVLLTPSYALHISLAELIPNMLRAGVFNIAKAGIAVNSAKLGFKIDASNAAADAAERAATHVAQLESKISLSAQEVKDLERFRAQAQDLVAAADQQKLHAVSAVAWRLIGGTRLGSVPEMLDNQRAIAEAEQALARAKQLGQSATTIARRTTALEDARAAQDAMLTTNLAKRLHLAARYVEANDGHYQSLGLSAGDAHSNNYIGGREAAATGLLRNATRMAPKMLATDNFTEIGRESTQYADAWQSWIREIANDEKSKIGAQTLRDALASGKSLDQATAEASNAVADWIRSQPKTYLDQYTRSLPYIDSFPLNAERPAGMDSADDWAHIIVHNIRGATRGADQGMIHDSLLEHIQNGTTPGARELDAIDFKDRPALVKGRELLPGTTGKIEEIANKGFNRVLNPMVNFLSRQPIAFQEFETQWARLEPKIANGIMSEDEAMVTAMDRTVQGVIRNIHNLHDRTQWTVTLRNWAPFYFAQEQAYRRMGRLLAQNPRAFRQYQLMISNMHNVGNIFGGKNGQNYFVIPGSGFLTAGVAEGLSAIGLPIDGSAPVGMGWNLNSTSVVFPLSSGIRPDLGPLAAIPTAAIAQFFPETLSPVLKSDLSTAATGILGPTATEPIYSQMVPNVIVQRLLTAAFPAFNERSFNSTMMQTLQTLDYEHLIPPPNAAYREMQAFIDRVQNQTRIMYAMKAIVGAVTPVSPEIQVQNFGFPTELTNDITKTGSVSKGIMTFLAEHPDATAYTVFQSSNLAGTSVPSSVQAEQWINNNYGLINKYPNAGILMMPMETNPKYNAAVYNAQIAQSLRSKLAPGEWTQNGQVPSYIDQLYIAAGNAVVLGKWYPQYEQQIAGMTGSEKYTAEQNWYNTTLPNYANQNPVWGNWWNSNTRVAERIQAIQQMQQMFKAGDAPNTEIAQETRGLLGDYQTYQNQIAAGRQDNFAGEKQAQINQGWKDYLYSVAADHPELINVITGLFLSLPTANATTSATTGSSGTPGTFMAKNWRAV